MVPYDLSAEIMNYYHKILELGSVNNFRERLHFLWPDAEITSTFPVHTSLSRSLLYSPRAIKRVKALIKNKYAYIVPGYPSNDDILLATTLNVPCYSGDP